MPEGRSVLLVDDMPMSAVPIKAELCEAGWRVRWVTSAAEGRAIAEQAARTREQFDLFAIDLGLPPDIDDPLVTGVPLVRLLRISYPEVPIVAYTVNNHKLFPYELILRELLPLNVSFFHSRERETDFVSQLADLVARGYFIVSPAGTIALPRTVPQRPDPLGAENWQILRRISERETYAAIALHINGLRNEGSVRGRVDRQIRPALVDAGWLSPSDTDQMDLKYWFDEHAARYRRDARAVAAEKALLETLRLKILDEPGEGRI